MTSARNLFLALALIAVGCGGGGGPAPTGTAGSGGSGTGGGGGGSGGNSGAQSPAASINHPGDGETRQATESIPFIGVANDPQDGALTGAALVWTRNQAAQPFGTGEQFSAMLPVGDHVITLTATDSDGNKGTASITLHVR
jgi:hypothetical protein